MHATHAGLLLLALLAGANEDLAPSTDERIEYYSQVITSDPNHYPSHALIGQAYFDKARETGDPQWLSKARAALKRSNDLQPNFEALRGMAAVSNHSHRFEEALRWAALAAQASPEDTLITAMRVEAHLGLGEADEARKLLPPSEPPPDDFYLAASLAQWLAAEGRSEEAASLFLAASKTAGSQNQQALATWALVSAAGVWLDGGQLERGRPLLSAAAKQAPADRFLRIHQAELAEAENRPEAALEIYEQLLREKSDAELHGRAFLLARQLMKDSVAQNHFEQAERIHLRAVESGEVYSLEGLARLYCDADVKLEDAVAFARRNLEHKRDRGAREVLAQAIQKAMPPPKPADTFRPGPAAGKSPTPHP
jgi:thioredoxin-like negative regulator of GroEL